MIRKKKIIEITFQNLLRPDFVKNSLYIRFNAIQKTVISAVFTTYEYGVLNFSDGKKEIHKWESEEQIGNVSSFSRHFPVTLLNGIDRDKANEELIYEEMNKLLTEVHAGRGIIKIYELAIKQIKNGPA